MLQDDEIDALLGDENDTFLDSIRSKRIEELSSKAINSIKSNFDTSSDYETWGYLSEIGHEKEVLHLSTSVPRLLIHFYNPVFKNCQLLNEHLHKLAKKFPATRFVFIEATKAPFMIVKMKVQVLPCIICIVDSIVADRLIGFDDLGGTDQFTSKQLEERLSSHSRILQIPQRLKKSADRRDCYSDSDESDYDDGVSS